MSVREDRSGRLVQKAAVIFDLRNPLRIKPKTAMVETTYRERSAMPEKVEIEANVAFEGFMVRLALFETIGLPDPGFFIFYDDVDYALRARRAGFRIWAVRDAALVRQAPAFDQQHDLSGWKGYYMYRNLFTVHRRYGENRLVRAKPWLIAAGVVALSPMRGGQDEVRNVSQALMDSRRDARLVAMPEPVTREAPPLRGRVISTQAWRDLTFVHWAVDPGRRGRSCRPASARTCTRAARTSGWCRSGWSGRPGRGPAALRRHLPRDQRPPLLGGRDRSAWRRLPQPRHRPRVLVPTIRVLTGAPYRWARLRLRRDGDRVTYEARLRRLGARPAAGSSSGSARNERRRRSTTS